MVGKPPKPPQVLIIFSRKTPMVVCWGNPTILGTPDLPPIKGTSGNSIGLVSYIKTVHK